MHCRGGRNWCGCKRRTVQRCSTVSAGQTAARWWPRHSDNQAIKQSRFRIPVTVCSAGDNMLGKANCFADCRRGKSTHTPVCFSMHALGDPCDSRKLHTLPTLRFYSRARAGRLCAGFAFNHALYVECCTALPRSGQAIATDMRGLPSRRQRRHTRRPTYCTLTTPAQRAPHHPPRLLKDEASPSFVWKQRPLATSPCHGQHATQSF